MKYSKRILSKLSLIFWVLLLSPYESYSIWCEPSKSTITLKQDKTTSIYYVCYKSKDIKDVALNYYLLTFNSDDNVAFSPIDAFAKDGKFSVMLTVGSNKGKYDITDAIKSYRATANEVPDQDKLKVIVTGKKN